MYIYTRIMDETTTKNSIEVSNFKGRINPPVNVQAHAYNVFFFLVFFGSTGGKKQLRKKSKTTHSTLALLWPQLYKKKKKSLNRIAYRYLSRSG